MCLMKTFGFIELNSKRAKTRMSINFLKKLNTILIRIMILNYSLVKMDKANQAKANQSRIKIRHRSFTFIQLSIANQIKKIIILIKYFKCSIKQKLINKNSTLDNFMRTQISMILFLKINGIQNNASKYIKAMLTIYTSSKFKAENKMCK